MYNEYMYVLVNVFVYFEYPTICMKPKHTWLHAIISWLDVLQDGLALKLDDDNHAICRQLCTHTHNHMHIAQSRIGCCLQCSNIHFKGKKWVCIVLQYKVTANS
jgi:hypothetical protein